MISYICIAAGAFVIGGLVGAIAVAHKFHCEHKWNKVMDHELVDAKKNATGHVQVYMCERCGKIIEIKV